MKSIIIFFKKFLIIKAKYKVPEHKIIISMKGMGKTYKDVTINKTQLF